jgi:hypothetical protein
MDVELMMARVASFFSTQRKQSRKGAEREHIYYSVNAIFCILLTKIDE